VYLAKPFESCATILDGFRYAPASHPEIDKFISSQMGEHVRSVSLDRFREMHGIQIIDLVKVDVEGAEFLVLQGARKSLEEGRIQNMMIELHNRNRREELEEILAKNNFSSRWIDSDHLFASHNPSYCLELP
jgi:hypothetical protein